MPIRWTVYLHIPMLPYCRFVFPRESLECHVNKFSQCSQAQFDRVWYTLYNIINWIRFASIRWRFSTNRNTNAHWPFQYNYSRKFGLKTRLCAYLMVHRAILISQKLNCWPASTKKPNSIIAMFSSRFSFNNSFLNSPMTRFIMKLIEFACACVQNFTGIIWFGAAQIKFNFWHENSLNLIARCYSNCWWMI